MSAPVRASDWLGRLTPVQQQLLGGTGDPSGDRAWATAGSRGSGGVGSHFWCPRRSL